MHTIRLGTAPYGKGRITYTARLELRVGDLAGDLAARGAQTVNHEPCPPNTLTLSATFEGKVSGNVVSCGAGLPGVRDELTEEGGKLDIPRATLDTIRLLADRWHLNTMHAECTHQRPLPASPGYPNNVLIPACPVSGYRYGHAWLVEPLPADVLDTLADLGVTAP